MRWFYVSFFLNTIWFWVKLVILFVFVGIGILVLLSGDGMLTFHELLNSVTVFLLEQFQIVIHWLQVRLGI